MAEYKVEYIKRNVDTSVWGFERVLIIEISLGSDLIVHFEVNDPFSLYEQDTWDKLLKNEINTLSFCHGMKTGGTVLMRNENQYTFSTTNMLNPFEMSSLHSLNIPVDVFHTNIKRILEEVKLQKLSSKFGPIVAARMMSDPQLMSILNK